MLALGTAQRNIAAALVVAGQNFSDPKVVVMVAIVAIVGMLILMPLARVVAKRNSRAYATGSTRGEVTRQFLLPTGPFVLAWSWRSSRSARSLKRRSGAYTLRA